MASSSARTSPQADSNPGKRRILPMHPDHNWQDLIWYEAPREDPAFPEVYVYTDQMSYLPGEQICIHASSTASRWDLEIYRDGAQPLRVHGVTDLPGVFTPTPKEAYRVGCNWPISHRWRLAADTPSGFYRIKASCSRPDGTSFVQHHFFVVRPTKQTRKGPLLHVLPTATWTAYNDWGGANHYAGIDGQTQDQPSPCLSLQRPWTRGLVWLPENAPRFCTPVQQPNTPPRYEAKEWAYAHGFGFFYASSGWAQYDRHFAVWAELEGYAFDTITQTDLHYHPEILSDYRCVVIVGHDEYWTREMRLAIEEFVLQGGNLARLGANFSWQIRLEDQGARQICYKTRACLEDPVRETDNRHLLTTAWEDRAINWPGTSTVGVNGLSGVYASWGGFMARGTRGFTVYRPDHWAFEATDLAYGDVFGAEARIFGYEVDGVDYTFREGLPYPTGNDGAALDIEILAMSPAVHAEGDYFGTSFRPYIGHRDQHENALLVFGEVTPDTLAKSRYGSGMMVCMQRGRGEVLTAASTDWVMGLKRGCTYTQQITRNILNRFISQG